MIRNTWYAILIALALSPAAISAAPLRAAISPIGGFNTVGNWPVPTVVGVEFRPTESILVESLGAFDAFRDGLLAARPVGLFDVSTGAALRTAEVPAGTSAQLVGDFRYTSIAPVHLLAFHTYQVVALHSGPNIETREGRIRDIDVRLDSELSSFQMRFTTSPLGGQLAVATGPAPVFSFGPNFLFRNIPEPSTAVLAIFALVAGGARRRTFASHVGQAVPDVS